MDVNLTNPAAEAFYYHWGLIRDCIAGEYTIKQRGEAYLPRKSGQSDYEYNAYKARAKWADYTEQALDALHGMIFRRMPSIEVPENEKLKQCLENFDREGHSFYQFASNTCYDNMQTNFGGLILDMPNTEGEVLTEYDAMQKGLDKPFCRYYKAENVRDWGFADINGSQKLSYVILREYVDDNAGHLGHEIRPQYRVLDFDDEGFYRVRVYKEFEVIDPQGKASVDYELVGNPILVRINGERLRYIPFWFLPYQEPQKPMLYGTAELNKHYYMQSADYENGVHFTTLPTAVITGYHDEKDHIHLGSDVAIEIPEAEAKAYTLVFSGEGLTHCEAAIAATQEQIGILGTRAISPDKAMSETSDAAKIHRQGEHAKLATYARDISEVFTKVVQTMADWLKINGKVNVQFNVDYDTLTFDPNMLNAIANLSREGKFPLPFIYEALVRGEIIPNGFTFAQFMLLLDLEAGGISAAEEIEAYQKLRSGEKVEISEVPINQIRNSTLNNNNKNPEDTKTVSLENGK